MTCSGWSLQRAVRAQDIERASQNLQRTCGTTTPESQSGDQAFSHCSLRYQLYRRPPSIQSFQKADLVPRRATSRSIFRQSSFHTYEPDATEHHQRWDREGAEAWPFNGSLLPCPQNKSKGKKLADVTFSRRTAPRKHGTRPAINSYRYVAGQCCSPVSRHTSTCKKVGQVHR
jgi:hypothetical protein